jgi:hypothetical protein
LELAFLNRVRFDDAPLTEDWFYTG